MVKGIFLLKEKNLIKRNSIAATVCFLKGTEYLIEKKESTRNIQIKKKHKRKDIHLPFFFGSSFVKSLLISLFIITHEKKKT